MSIAGGIAIVDNLLVAIEYDANNNPIYIGVAVPGTAKSDAKWKISKQTYDNSNNLTDRQWADGDIDYNKKWDDRAIYGYK